MKYRRSGNDRRTGWPAVCVMCGKFCDSDRGWHQGASTIETKIECRTGICSACSRKKFPQFYKEP